MRAIPLPRGGAAFDHLNALDPAGLVRLQPALSVLQMEARRAQSMLAADAGFTRLPAGRVAATSAALHRLEDAMLQCAALLSLTYAQGVYDPPPGMDPSAWQPKESSASSPSPISEAATWSSPSPSAPPSC